MTKKTTLHNDCIPKPESRKVTCIFCKKVDDNYNMTFKSERNGYVCDTCLNKEFKGGREFLGKFKLRSDY